MKTTATLGWINTQSISFTIGEWMLGPLAPCPILCLQRVYQVFKLLQLTLVQVLGWSQIVQLQQRYENKLGLSWAKLSKAGTEFGYLVGCWI